MSDLYEKYKHQLGVVDEFAKGSSSSSNNGSNNSANNYSSGDYYQMARDQEYSALLDREIELETAKQNALKYTNNQMAAQGYATQGYGSSNMTGIYNQYMNAMSGAKRDYQTNLNNINYQEYQDRLAENNNRFGMIVSMISDGYGNIDLINQMLSDYQLGNIDENGNFVFGEKPENMSDDDWNRIKYAYNIQLRGEQSTQSAYYKDEDSFRSTATFDTGNGKSSLISEKFKHETNKLMENINNGVYKEGTVIMMQNGSGQKVYVKVENGGFRIVTESEYNNATNNGNSAYLVWGKNVSKTTRF